MSTYLAAWAILPDTYGKQVSNDSEPKVDMKFSTKTIHEFELTYLF